MLSQDANEATLITKKMVTTKKYHNTTPYPTWSASDIRTWLNGDYKSTLSTEMQTLLKEETLQTAHEFGDWTALDSSTDKVYLLTETDHKSQAVGKNPGDDALMTTDQLKCDGITEDGITTGYWWLRSPRNQVNNSGIVECVDGSFHNNNVNDMQGVRPTVTINLKQFI